MSFLIENWYLIIALLGLLIGAGLFIKKFIKMPTDKQLIKVKEWLLYGVIQAEKELGEGTGQIKLRFVYDMFITKFKWISRMISFEMFSLLVDEALEEMRKILSTNKAVNQLVKKEVE